MMDAHQASKVGIVRYILFTSVIFLLSLSCRMASSTEPQHQEKSSFKLIEAPNREEIPPGNKTIFLSGSTISAKTLWQADLAQALSHLPITVFNPHRVSHSLVTAAPQLAFS